MGSERYECHCHILPGLDDGAADLEESLFLCRWLVRRGYGEAVCTPHCNRLYHNTEDEIRKLVEAGFQPVLAHPERYLWASPADYARWRAAGAAFQRNLGALEGFYGDPARQRAQYLFSAGAYTFLGSDLHNRRYAEFFDEFCGTE